MRVEYGPEVLTALNKAPDEVRKAFFKQIELLERNLQHPSLRAKKYDASAGRWQGRVNREWRFYFRIERDAYRILKLIPHPK